MSKKLGFSDGHSLKEVAQHLKGVETCLQAVVTIKQLPAQFV